MRHLIYSAWFSSLAHCWRAAFRRPAVQKWQNKYCSCVMPGHRRRQALFPGEALKRHGATSPRLHPPGLLSCEGEFFTRVTRQPWWPFSNSNPILVTCPWDTPLPNHCTPYRHSIFFCSLFLKCLRLGFKSIILVFLSLTALYPIIMLQQQLQKYSLDNWGQCLFSADRRCFPRCSYTLLLWRVIQRHNKMPHFCGNSKVVGV